MWFEFFRASVIGLVLLYAPGYVFFRGINLSRLLAFCAAPLYITCMASVLPILYYGLDVPCGLLTVLGPAVALAIIVWLMRQILSRRNPKGKPPIALDDMGTISLPHLHLPFDVMIPTLVVAVATIVCILVFLNALPSADAINPRYDNMTHLNLARAYLDSGKWSSLHSSTFLASSEAARSNATLNFFYPGAWTCIIVLMSIVAQVDLMVCVNAITALAASVVFPLGMYVFMRAILPPHRRTIALGAIAITGFSHWPWLYILTGPLLPNQYGIALQFCTLAVILVVLMKNEVWKRFASLSTFSLISFCALALTHPTTIFSSYVFMAFYGAHAILRGQYIKGRLRIRALVLLAYLSTVVAFWALCLKLPMLQSVIGYTEVIRDELPDVFYEFFSMRFSFASIQIGMAAASVIGCVVALLRKDLRWLLGPIAYFAIGYVATRTDWWIVKHWLTSLWYSDWRRMCVNMTLYLIPLTAVGLDTILPSPRTARQSAPPSAHQNKTAFYTHALQSLVFAWIRTIAFCAILFTAYLPLVEVPVAGIYLEGSLAKMSSDLHERYMEEIFCPDEVAFVRKAMDVIPPDALVVNNPADGSVWAYGVCDLNAYFRSILTVSLTDDANLIRESLKDYTTNPDVREALTRTGAMYVLQLDKGVSHEDGHWLWQYTEDQVQNWRGIDEIDEETPGFSVVLAEGSDMRLYKIDNQS